MACRLLPEPVLKYWYHLEEANFGDISINLQTFPFTKIRLKMSSAQWQLFCRGHDILTALVTHIFVIKLTITSSDNGLSLDRGQAIIWFNAGILSIRTLGTNFTEFLSKIHTFSFKKMHLRMTSAKRRSFSLCLNVLKCLKLWQQELYFRIHKRFYFICRPRSTNLLDKMS